VTLAEAPNPAGIRINGKEFATDGGREITIGRDPAADVHLDDPKVSRRHAVVEAEGNGWVFRDKGSRNGSYRDGQRVTEVAVTGDVRLTLGGSSDGVAVELSPVRLRTGAQEPTGRTRIGRTGDNDVVLADDLRVSRRHAELVRAGSSAEIVDVGSSNGTFVNGQRVERAALSEGDLVTIGNHLFRFVAGDLEEYAPADIASFQAVSLRVRTDEGKPILQDVSFFLEPSQLLAVVGPSGSGKTTLLNALTGFRPAQTGSVLFGGRDLYASFDDLRQRIGFVPQDDILHPQLTIRRALEFAAELRFSPDVDAKTRSERVTEVMKELDLTGRADLQIERLSGGQRKRVSVALELLTRPSLLFLDEPTSGLDPGNERQVMALLRELATGGRTVIVVTHSTQSLHICDRVLFMAPGGRMAYYGPPNEALEYFNRHGAGRFYADVFTRLEEHPEADWPGQLKADPGWDKYVQRPLAVDAAVRSARPPQSLPPPRQQPWKRQFSVLVRRYVALIRSDRRYLLLLILQAPVLGVVLAAMFGPRRLSIEHGPEALILMMALVLGMTWLSILNAIREIVKEYPIYRRERSVGLSISAYIASKAVVLGTFTAFQAVMLVVIGLSRQKVFQYDPRTFDLLPVAHGALLPAPKFELIIDVALTGLAAMALGLLVSAVSSNADKALTIVPILIVPQLVLAGGLFPVNAPLFGQLKYVASAQWGMSSVASTIDLNTVQTRIIALGTYAANPCDLNDPVCSDQFLREIKSKQQALWKHKAGVWLADAFALLLLTALGLLGAYQMLKRRDVHVLAGTQARAGPLANLLAAFKSFGHPAKAKP
jgi:ABC-type multidrug transport system ATPase subunit